MRRLIDHAPDAMEYLWARRRASLDAAGANLAERRRVVDDFLRVVVSSSAYGAIDEVRRGQLAQHIGHLLNIPAADLQQQMRRLARQAPGAPSARAGAERQAQPGPLAIAERHILEVLLNRPDLFGSVSGRVGPEDFSGDRLRPIATCLWRLGAAGGWATDELLAKEEMSGSGSLLAELLTEGERRGNYEQTLSGAVEQIAGRRSREELQELKKSGLDDDALRKLPPRLGKADMRRFPGLR
jgi:hypothetical protein